jgi:PAS domain S-box-containing protein
MADNTATDAFLSALAEDDPAELYENAPCAYLSALPDGTIIKANATFLAWTGYDRGALVGTRRFQDLLPAGDRIFYETHVAPMLLMQGRLREISVQVISASGARLPMLLNAEVLRASGGLTAQKTADALVAAVLAFQDGQPRDDIAVVVVKAPPPSRH